MTPQPDPSLPEIQSAIPHRGAMLLVDEVVSLDESSIVCRKTFSPDEFFFQGHYPEFPLTPGVILCECAAQAGAVLLSGKVTADEGIPVLTRMDKVRFKEIVYPGQTIEIDCHLDDQLANAFYLTAKVTCQGKTAARLSFVCTIANPGNN